jgi:hypothetical protein
VRWTWCGGKLERCCGCAREEGSESVAEEIARFTQGGVYCGADPHLLFCKVVTAAYIPTWSMS